jgi:hypothetical protein
MRKFDTYGPCLIHHLLSFNSLETYVALVFIFRSELPRRTSWVSTSVFCDQTFQLGALSLLHVTP